MAYKMTNQGTTNEFMCETTDDLTKIPKDQINFGSVAVVIDGAQIFIANSAREWCSMTTISSGE